MHAMILAAGRGERMRPLTDVCPKPLLMVGGKSLLEWQIERLARGGFCDIVINHAHLGHMIEEALGDGARHGVRLGYSHEAVPLETAGGIAQALPLLGDGPFLAVSGDVYTDYDYARLQPAMAAMRAERLARVAHFVLADNPPHHLRGDMSVEHGIVGLTPGSLLNYSGIGLFQPWLFADMVPGTKKSLFPWMFDYVRAGQVSGEHHDGTWVNVGTPQQLTDLDAQLRVAP